GDITISGGTVTANGGSLAAGIGGYGGSGSVTISGGTVTANSGDGGGAGIGGSYDGGGGDITISGGQVTATGRGGGAGIGDGCWGAGGNVTISGGQVTATGRDGGPGVGKGSDESGAILIAPPAGILIDVYVGSQAPGSPLAGSPFAEETAYTGTDQYFHSLARPLTYTIAPIADQTMTPLVVGYADGDQETKPITIERTGTGDLTHLAVALGGAHPGSYVITQPLATTLDDSTTSTTFTVKAAPGLTVGTYTATVTISATNMADVTINVIQEVAPAAPIITTSSLPNGTVGTPYSQTLAATGDTPITWSIAAGDLPDGLTLAGNTISGTPTTAGIFSFTVRATNSAGDDAKGLSITINSAAPLCTRADVAAVIYGAPEGTPVRAYVGGTEQPTLYSAHDAFGRQAVLWTFYPPASTDWTVRVEPQLPPGLEAPRWQYKLVWIEPAPPGFVSGAAAGSAVTVSRCSGTVLHFQLVDTGAQ
ncbi:MAG TPA: Ig domain-containing protein, partial [Anaerolineae bacterium]|nr:Ig domain-containing protein [Anaerolineae bacterium]